MRIGLIGGTGGLGKGLALRWAKKHEIFVGSRTKEKAEDAARDYLETLNSRGEPLTKIVGLQNQEVVISSEVVIFAVPYEPSIDLARTLIQGFSKQIVISPLVPLKKTRGLYVYCPRSAISAAEELRNNLKASVRVVSALHTIAASRLIKPEPLPLSDVIVCADDIEAKKIVMGLITEIEGLNALDGGPLKVSRLVEPVVPLLLNVSHFSRILEPTVKIV